LDFALPCWSNGRLGFCCWVCLVVLITYFAITVICETVNFGGYLTTIWCVRVLVTHTCHTLKTYLFYVLWLFFYCVCIYFGGGGGEVFAIYVLVLAECIWGTHGCNHLVLLESF
jgi:hypothetical protein